MTVNKSNETRFKHNFKIFITFGILFELMNSFYMPFAIKFLERVGGTEFDISLFNSMKGLIMIFAVLPGVFYINRHDDKKKVTSNFVLIVTILVLSLVVIPFLPGAIRPFSFILIMTLMTIPTSIYNASYQNFTGDLFPVRRAQVIAKRSMYTIVFTTVFTLISGLIFKYVPKTDDQRLIIYQIFFVLAFVLGLVAVYVFNKFDYSPAPTHKRYEFKGSFTRVFSNKRFKKFVLSSTIFHFGWQMGWPLFSIYMIKTLGADELWLAIINIGSASVMFLGHKIWPKMIDTYGNEKIATICTLGMALTPILYALSPNLLVLTVVSTVTGFFTAGTITVLFSDMLEVTPTENRIVYVGYYNTATNITLAISPFVGLFFLNRFGIVGALFITAGFRFIGGLAFYLRERSERKYLEKQQ
ncbi:MULTISPECIES: MFS transporter [unclassified Fusibacter]|uniref:MFS transporter n=1 Tax=unclassified Fusibacter TaxID=2624464 RepID=UPI00101151E1|nr:MULTISPECIES: MFS transporter [unclassified Fusibacter]MCK8061237.1 MFS transporter [Fusibacter sp. A2]NPE23419.1 MFS transporter [Fusibacter sp. A1]RXV59198.1 MFS transporter [Fusibacter sp. A1]